MRAILLAAGYGTRLGAVSRRRPKALVEILGRPLLAWQLDYLAAQGVRHVTVTAHHLHEQIAGFAAAYDGPVRLEVAVEPRLRGTAGSVLDAFDRGEPRSPVVLYGDVLTRVALAPLVERHAASGGLATIAVYEAEEVAGKGLVQLDADRRVSGFREKDPAMHGPALINAGIYVIEPELFAGLSGGDPLDFGHDVFPAALAAGAQLDAHVLDTPVLDAGTPEGLAAAQRFLAPRAEPAAENDD